MSRYVDDPSAFREAFDKNFTFLAGFRPNVRLSAGETAHVLDDSLPKAHVFDDTLASMTAQALALAGHVSVIVVKVPATSADAVGPARIDEFERPAP
ncbi:MAG TPA: hypothetical protein VGI58_20620 [Streptosporangiaceae bacterium]|jgi:hypothetical protein